MLLLSCAAEFPEARGIVKSSGRTPALPGASAAAGRGEILAIMGPSGSGTSTLLRDGDRRSWPVAHQKVQCGSSR
ncbi:MAG TPA: hypothetical protein VGS06_24435 [Streptosporangiaceae bacterium]|nr:hypothetical protein [Streptosporangiaceae bacterium]